MRILFNGLPYFTKKLVDELNTFDSSNNYVFLNTYQSKWAQIKFLLSLPFCKKAVSMNGVSDKSGSLSWVVRFKKPLIMQWQGTDVLLLKDRKQKGTVYDNYLKYAEHYTDATWLQKELKELGIVAKLLAYKNLPAIKDTNSFNEISMLTYLGKGREVFYGWNTILETMRSLENVHLYVMGTDGEGLEQLSNITFLAWVNKDEVIANYKKCPIFVRMTEHDGYSLSIMEALSYGLEVIWNNPHECTYLVKNTEELTASVKEISKLITTRNFQQNSNNKNWVEKNMNREIVLHNYIQTITK